MPKRKDVWVCVECGDKPKGETQPSVDPRWRLGRCSTCKNKSAIFAVTRKEP